jgi:hypothetical protein
MKKMNAIQQQTELIQLLKSINNGSKEIEQQVEYAEKRLRVLEQRADRLRERSSFVRRIEQEVGQEKLSHYFTQYGLAHLYPLFCHMTLDEFKHSDPIYWAPMGERELRQVLFLL